MNINDGEAFARKLRALIIERYGTLAEAARAAAMPPQALSRLLHHPFERRVSTIVRLLDALGLELVIKGEADSTREIDLPRSRRE